MPAVAQRLTVQGAAAAAGEIRVVEKHARPVGPGRRAAGRLRTVHGVHLGVVLEATAVVLPGLRRQGFRRRADPLLVVLIGEEGTVGAASVTGSARDDAVTALAEDARPPR